MPPKTDALHRSADILLTSAWHANCAATNDLCRQYMLRLPHSERRVVGAQLAGELDLWDENSRTVSEALDSGWTTHNRHMTALPLPLTKLCNIEHDNVASPHYHNFYVIGIT